MTEPVVETHVLHLSAEAFIEDPSLFAQVERIWTEKDWLTLLGCQPLGAVVATLPPEGGVTFYYRTPAPGD